jgi:hypothetical protein
MTVQLNDLMIYVADGDPAGAGRAARLIEEGQWYQIGKGWRARSDKPHASGQPHVHVYFRRNELYVINQDGTPSHNRDLSTMPARVHDFLKARRLIEGTLVETAGAAEPVLVPPAVIAAAIDAWLLDRLRYLAGV